MVMGNKSKYFSPSLSSEKLAARVYDRYVIQSLGLRAKTNFNYNRLDLIRLIKDIETDLEYNVTHHDNLDRQRIEFSRFKIPAKDL